MATVHVAVASAGALGQHGSSMPVFDAIPSAKQVITSSAASQASTISAPAGTGPLFATFWSVTALDAAVWVQFGTAPVASAGNDWLVPAGATREWKAQPGDKIAVINA